METLQIRLPRKQLSQIDREVREGIYRSRSEAVRDALERLNFLALMDSLGDIIKKEGLKKEEALKELKKIRAELYKKYI